MAKKKNEIYDHKDLYEDEESIELLNILRKQYKETRKEIEEKRTKAIKKERIKNAIINWSIVGMTIILVVLLTIYIYF